jgi:PilZ domain-containing protein/sporulation related protein
MMNPERRQSPRTTVNRLAYINLEANNGGIVLNVSKGGLCFHSVAPVPRTDTIRFWFSEPNHRIEADGKLAWMDETQKTAGLRFIHLSAEACVKIRDWISPPATPPAAGGEAAPALSSSSEFPAYNARRPDRNVARDGSAPLDVHSPNIKPPPLSAFSGGFVLGLLISALVATAFLLHTYRRELGNSLIQLGERLGARYQAQTVSPAPERASPAPLLPPLLEKFPIHRVTKEVKPQRMKSDAAAPVTAARAPTSNNVTVTAPAFSSSPPPTPLSTTAIEPAASHIPGKVGTAPELGPAKDPSGHSEDSREVEAGSSSRMYLEVGRFRDAVGADNATNRLTQLGFHAIAINKRRLWMNSYQVLVGPYGSDDEAETAHMNLVSHGFRPRSYEKGFRTLTLPSAVTLNGTHMPVGLYFISWDSYVPDVFVKFEKDSSVITTAEGKWVRRPVRYEDDAIVYRKNGDGSRTLLEIRFAGMSKALVFGKSS